MHPLPMRAASAHQSGNGPLLARSDSGPAGPPPQNPSGCAVPGALRIGSGEARDEVYCLIMIHQSFTKRFAVSIWLTIGRHKAVTQLPTGQRERFPAPRKSIRSRVSGSEKLPGFFPAALSNRYCFLKLTRTGHNNAPRQLYSGTFDARLKCCRFDPELRPPLQSANDLLSSSDTWPGNADWQTETFHVHAA